MYSLFIDSHDKNVVIVLYKDGKVFKESIIESVNKHSQIVMPELKKVFDSVGLSIRDVKEIFVCNGPGSFTGERIAVTIAKTIAYCLNIPIKVIDCLRIGSLNIFDNVDRYVYLPDKKGAFIAGFNSNSDIIFDFVYLNNSDFISFIDGKNSYNINDLNIDYNLIYNYLLSKDSMNAHAVKPLYVKGISALDDKKN